jgi:dynein assembly factor 3, axonemal
MADQLVRGIGHHGLWGFSPAFDFVEAIFSACDLDPGSLEPLNILLVQPGDIRHVLYTISRRKRHPRRPIHFYLLEPNLEILARDLLLLEVSIDFEIPIRQRANIFLEIFGNALVQERTARYIEQMGQKLISLAVNSTATLELVDLCHLKYKDRDGLEEVFKSYNRKNLCDMASLRDHRMRGYYAERYDSRRALGDWDWQYSYRETAGSIVHITLYRDWREKGIAFEFGDQSYVEANRTMLTFVEGTLKRGKDAGHHKEVTPSLSPPFIPLPSQIKGFWTDIVSSPYFSFGLETDSRSPPLTPKAAEFTAGLFEILNKVCSP